jgi:hypothetical protein
MNSFKSLMNQEMDLTLHWFGQRISFGVSIDERDRHVDDGAELHMLLLYMVPMISQRLFRRTQKFSTRIFSTKTSGSPAFASR